MSCNNPPWRRQRSRPFLGPTCRKQRNFNRVPQHILAVGGISGDQNLSLGVKPARQLRKQLLHQPSNIDGLSWLVQQRFNAAWVNATVGDQLIARAWLGDGGSVKPKSQ